MAEAVNTQIIPEERSEATVGLQNEAQMHQAHEVEDSRVAFAQFLHDSSSIQEIAVSGQHLLQAGGELIQRYGIRPEFFSDRSRSLVFSAITLRNINAQSDVEREFLTAAITLLGYSYSDRLGEIFKQSSEGRSKVEYSGDYLRSVYDRYTDATMSGRLQEAISAGSLLNDVRTRLGITAANEDTFSVRVLSIGDTNALHGFEPPRLPNWDDLPGSYQDKQCAIAEANEIYDDVRSWKRDLVVRQEQFRRETGSNAVAPAWISKEGGATTLFLPLPLAEKLLDQDVTTNAAYYDEASAARDRAMFEHEFVHTQGGLNLDGGIDFGITIEELRAEHFSGNKHGYLDAKAFARDIGIITGKDLTAYFSEGEKGGSSYGIYMAIAEKVGLERMLEIITVRPASYDIEQANILNRTIAEYLGGYDGVVRRVLADGYARGEASAIEQRISSVAHNLSAFSGAEDYLAYRRRQGNVFMTDKIEQRMQQMQDSQ